MKKILPIILACLCWCGMSYGQMTNVTVDQIPHDASIPELTGQTTYRVFVNTVSGTDFLTSVIGSDEYPLDFTTSTNFYRSAAHSSELLSGISSFLVDNFGVVDLRYSSGVTIGQISDSKYGTPVTAGNPLGEIPGGGGSTTSIPDPDANWIPQFTAGGNIEINTFTGGAWLALNGGFNQASNLNGYGTGVNNSILIGQFTTDGDFSFNFSPLILENIEGEGTSNTPHQYYWNVDEGLGLTYPVAAVDGCTDVTACNYDDLATEQDDSCLYNDTCGVCDGDDSSCTGCTELEACNYDSTATVAGDCDFDSCAGCTIPEACNYDPNASISLDSCLEEDCNGDCGGDSVLDDCGVCAGDNTACLDCAGVVNGTSVVDDCGVCAGDNTTCLDCAGVVNGTSVLDDCGVCAGDNTTCLDCAGVVNGTSVVDDCGVCAGDNTTCLDCAGVVNGTSVLDGCGVCGGDGSSCAEVPGCTEELACNYNAEATVNDDSCLEDDCNGDCGGDSVLDDCGVCAGDNTTCLDCAGVVNGTSVVDDCGVCAGDNTTCLDCAGVVNGTSVLDDCGVCAGDNTTCLDCAGVVNGTSVLDDCGVCAGDNTTCLDCAGVVNGTSVFDDCGICGGDGSSCAEVPGCTDDSACNFNPEATISDDSCEEAVLVFIPTELDFGPAVIACEAPVGYMLADQDCANTIILIDPFCLENYWDDICQDAYECCLNSGVFGCTDNSASNYDAAATCEDYSCEYDNDCTLVCPNDLTLECGSDISISATGTPFYQGECFFAGLEDWPFEDSTSGDACLTIIERTFFGVDGLECTQTITLTDSEGPVFPEVSDVAVECVEDIPAALMLTALDACTGEEIPSSSFESGGTATVVCELSTAFGPGDDWAVWLQGFSQGASDNFVWDANGGTFDQYADGTAHLYGAVVNDTDATQGWIVDLWFENGVDWTDWSSQGRWYKDDLGFGADEFEDWTYYEMVPFSTLTGTGSFVGDELLLSHNPETFFFGFQCGLGANNKNGNEGFSGWFNYEGNVGGEAVYGNGDVNVDKECAPNDDVPECTNDTQVTYLYRATDGCGNSTVITQVITVNDETAPVFVNPPADVTLQCENWPIELPECIATDNCVGTITYAEPIEIIVVGDCPNNITITRRWEATDECNNTAVHIQTITVIDEVAPVILCPADISHECDAPVDYGFATATDNCTDLPSVTVMETEEGDSCNMTITRVFTATDECGNSSTCTQTITIIDSTAPVFGAFNPYLPVECDELDSVEDAITVTDNCNDYEVTYTDVMNSGGCLGVLERTYTAIDACGNSSSIIQYISLQDTTAPEIDCPADMIYECDEIILEAVTPFVSDNCGLDVNVTFVETETGDSCERIITRTWTAVDYCENESVCTQVITVLDTTAPVILPPANVTYECDEEYELMDAIVSDNCQLAEVEETIEEIGDSCERVITRTFRAFDGCGNQSIATQTITIVDTQAPLIECPLSFTHSCDEAPDYGSAAAIDNCQTPVITVEVTEAGDSCNRTITRVFTATDGCGNSSSCFQTITIYDNEAPIITCPADVSHECDAPVDYGTATATDNCNEVSITSSDVTTGDSCETLIVRTWTATDACDNSSSCVQTITIVDTTAPVITGLIALDMPCDEIDQNFLATATDNCNEFTFTFVDLAVSGGCAGEVIRTYTATDACGNMSELIQIIDLFDDEAPEVTCAPDMTIECDEEMPAMTEPTYSDNCGEVELSLEVTDDEGECLRTVTRTWTATDECGNASTCSQVITIEDTTAPVITCPVDVSHECDALVDYGMAAATDNCNAVSITSSDVTTGDDCLTTITRTWTATDACNNSSTCVQTITIVDTTAPVITCPADVSHECDAPVDYGMATATDNCNAVSITSSDVTTGDDCLTTITRTWTATDACNNSSTCVQTITIVDTTVPVITCPTDVSHECDAPVDYGMATATDNCNTLSITFSDVTTGDSCETLIERTWTATDACNNSSTCVQTITIVDTTAPVITGLVSLDMPCDEIDENFLATATDNCSEFTFTFVDLAVSGGCAGEVIRTYTATDACGNMSEFVQIIDLFDDVAPEVTCAPDMTIECDEEMPAMTEPTYSDNCGEVELSLEVTDDEGECLRTVTRTWTATDDCGNASTCSQVITIEDTTGPVITCPADVSHECDALVDYGMATAMDNCNEVSITSSDVTTGDDCLTTIVRTWTATDACNNSSTCVQIITIADTTGPVITCPADVSHECDAPVDYGMATATDNCSTVSITSSDETTGGSCETLIVRTWTATDACNNSSTCVQTITIVDTTVPVITCPADLSLPCNSPPPALNFEGVIASDNCSTPVVTHVGDDFGGPGSGPCAAVIIRTYMATDDCGNSSTCEQLITIPVDFQAPTITCLEDVTIECDEEMPAMTEPTVFDACGEVTLTSEVTTDVGECSSTETRTWTATDACGNSSECVQTITIVDTTAPELTSEPADLVLGCEDSVPDAPIVTAIDNCDEFPVVGYEEEITGEQPEEGSIADCVLSTPAGPVCQSDPSWSLKLFSFPGYELFTSVDANFVEYADGTAMLTGTVQATNNPNAYFNIDVTFENGMNWADWSNQLFPTSFKDDCDTAEDTEVYLDWTYYIMQAGNASLTGAGDLEGSFFELGHAPSNLYYGYQVGLGANNVNGNYGNGGWFTGTGLLVDAATQTEVEIEGFQGDFAFDADCCPQYSIERTWTATDCAGNSVSHTQTITFADVEEEEFAEVEAIAVSFDSVDGGLFIGNIFPNPVSDRAQINYGVAKTSNVTLDVLDMNGSLVQTIFSGSAEAGVTYQQMFETAGIESGVYMVRLTGNNTAKFERVVVAK